jgi:hypothetical protein
VRPAATPRSPSAPGAAAPAPRAASAPSRRALSPPELAIPLGAAADSPAPGVPSVRSFPAGRHPSPASGRVAGGGGTLSSRPSRGHSTVAGVRWPGSPSIPDSSPAGAGLPGDATGARDCCSSPGPGEPACNAALPGIPAVGAIEPGLSRGASSGGAAVSCRSPCAAGALAAGASGRRPAPARLGAAGAGRAGSRAVRSLRPGRPPGRPGAGCTPVVSAGGRRDSSPVRSTKSAGGGVARPTTTRSTATMATCAPSDSARAPCSVRLNPALPRRRGRGRSRPPRPSDCRRELPRLPRAGRRAIASCRLRRRGARRACPEVLRGGRAAATPGDSCGSPAF